MADTAERRLKVPGVELEITLHWVPSQCSISPLLSEKPTAQISLAETAAMPLRELKLESGLGLETTFQLPQLDFEVAEASPVLKIMVINTATTTPPSAVNLRKRFINIPPLRSQHSGSIERFLCERKDLKGILVQMVSISLSFAIAILQRAYPGIECSNI